MRRVGVEDLLARDFRGDVAKHGRDFVSHSSNVPDDAQRRARSGAVGPAVLRPENLQTVADQVVVLEELRAVGREELSARAVQHAQELDIAFRVRDPPLERALVVVDAHQLNHHLLDQEENGGDQHRRQDLQHHADPARPGRLAGRQRVQRRRGQHLEGEQVRQTPSHQTQRDLDRAENGGVLLRPRRHDPAQEHEDEGDRLRQQLGHPDGEPDNQDPQPKDPRLDPRVDEARVAVQDAVDDRGGREAEAHRQDVHHVAGDDGEADHLVVEAAQARDGDDLAIGAAADGRPAVLLSLPPAVVEHARLLLLSEQGRRVAVVEDALARPPGARGRGVRRLHLRERDGVDVVGVAHAGGVLVEIRSKPRRLESMGERGLRRGMGVDFAGLWRRWMHRVSGKGGGSEMAEIASG